MMCYGIYLVYVHMSHSDIYCYYHTDHSCASIGGLLNPGKLAVGILKHSEYHEQAILCVPILTSHYSA